jgi:hypothetical protein
MKQLLICSCLLLVIACTTDSYETGEGRYSQTTADFAELRSNGQKQGISFLTDEGVNYIIENAVKAYAEGADRDTVLALWDLSFFENGKDGYLFTESGVYYPRFLDTPKFIDYSNILSSEIRKKGKKDCESILTLCLSDGSEEDWVSQFLNKTPLKAFFDALTEDIRIRRNGSGKISLYDSIQNRKITYE